MATKKCLLKNKEKELIKSYQADLDWYRKKLDKHISQLEKAAARKDTHNGAIVAMECAQTAQNLVAVKKKIKAIRDQGKYRAWRAEQAANGNRYPGGSLWTGWWPED